MTNSEMQQSTYPRFITKYNALSPVELLGAYQQAVRVQTAWIQLHTGREYWMWLGTQCYHCYGSGLVDYEGGLEICPTCNGKGIVR